MRKFIGFAFMLAALVAMASSTSAQAPQGKGKGGFGGGGFGGGRGFGGTTGLIAIPSVQEEIKVTDEQKDKLKGVADEARAAMADNRTKMTEMMKDLADATPEQRSAKMQAFFKEQNAPIEKKINEILKPDQVARLKQISLQQQGMAAFATDDVAKELALTDEEKDSIKKLNAEYIKDRQELMPAGGGRGAPLDAETQKKLTALTKEYNTKAIAVLTDAQKASWKKMTGEPFEVKFTPRVAPKKDD